MKKYFLITYIILSAWIITGPAVAMENELCGNGMIDDQVGEQCEPSEGPGVCTSDCTFNYCLLNQMDANNDGVCNLSDQNCFGWQLLQELDGNQDSLACKTVEADYNFDIDCNGVFGIPDIALIQGVINGDPLAPIMDQDNNGMVDMCEWACGNGNLEGEEKCDDGNININDGCNPACLIEVGYSCPTAGAPCVKNEDGPILPEESDNPDDAEDGTDGTLVEENPDDTGTIGDGTVTQIDAGDEGPGGNTAISATEEEGDPVNTPSDDEIDSESDDTNTPDDTPVIPHDEASDVDSPDKDNSNNADDSGIMDESEDEAEDEAKANGATGSGGCSLNKKTIRPKNWLLIYCMMTLVIWLGLRMKTGKIGIPVVGSPPLRLIPPGTSTNYADCCTSQ